MSLVRLTLFLLCFGIAISEALTDGRWPRIAFWLAMAGVVATLDWWSDRKRRPERGPTVAQGRR